MKLYSTPGLLLDVQLDTIFETACDWNCRSIQQTVVCGSCRLSTVRLLQTRIMPDLRSNALRLTRI